MAKKTIEEVKQLLLDKKNNGERIEESFGVTKKPNTNNPSPDETFADKKTYIEAEEGELFEIPFTLTDNNELQAIIEGNPIITFYKEYANQGGLFDDFLKEPELEDEDEDEFEHKIEDLEVGGSIEIIFENVTEEEKTQIKELYELVEKKEIIHIEEPPKPFKERVFKALEGADLSDEELEKVENCGLFD